MGSLLRGTLQRSSKLVESTCPKCEYRAFQPFFPALGEAHPECTILCACRATSCVKGSQSVSVLVSCLSRIELVDVVFCQCPVFCFPGVDLGCKNMCVE